MPLYLQLLGGDGIDLNSIPVPEAPTDKQDDSKATTSLEVLVCPVTYISILYHHVFALPMITVVWKFKDSIVILCI